MKTSTLLLLGLSIFWGNPSKADIAVDSKLKMVFLKDVDLSELVSQSSSIKMSVTGDLPNSCYKIQDAVEIDLDTYEHEIILRAQVEDGYCLQNLRPFSATLNFKALNPGQHHFVFRGLGRNIEKLMSVVESQ